MPTAPKTQQPEIQYLNTDLDLICPRSPGPLIAHLESAGLFALAEPRAVAAGWLTTLETEASFREPNPNLLEFLAAIDSMPAEARESWDACSLREFNLGYECGLSPWAFSHGIASETLGRISASAATLRLTLYPAPASASGSVPD